MNNSTPNQPRVRSWVAIAAHQRTSAGSMGKRGKGRGRKDDRSRQAIRANLRRNFEQ